MPSPSPWRLASLQVCCNPVDMVKGVGEACCDTKNVTSCHDATTLDAKPGSVEFNVAIDDQAYDHEG